MLGRARRSRRRDRRVRSRGCRSCPLFAKLPMHGADLGEIAHAVVRAGAHGLTVGGPPPALSVAGATQLRPVARRGHRMAVGSGDQADHAARRVRGGARGARDARSSRSAGSARATDAIEAILAGAWAVQVGTATLVDPEAPVAVAQGIVRYLKAKGLASPADVRGRLRVPAVVRAPSRTTRRPRRDPAPGEPADRRARRLRPRRAPSALAAVLAPHVGMLKVGFELFWAHGPEAVRRIASHGTGVRGREAARHPEHRRTRRREHRAARRRRCSTSTRSAGEAMMRAALRGAERARPRRGDPTARS